jgi:hypothetical protein
MEANGDTAINGKAAPLVKYQPRLRNHLAHPLKDDRAVVIQLLMRSGRRFRGSAELMRALPPVADRYFGLRFRRSTDLLQRAFDRHVAVRHREQVALPVSDFPLPILPTSAKPVCG